LEDSEVTNSLKKIQETYLQLQSEAVGNKAYGRRHIPQKGDEGDADVDFPYVDDPEGYVTHVPLEQDGLKEAEGDEESTPEEDKKIADEPPPPSDETEGGEGGVGDMGMDEEGNVPDVGGDMDMAEQQQEEELTANQIGRVYEMKKIYSRLIAVESLISRTTDDNMLEMRKLVSQGIDLFEVVISNYDKFKENIDEIIVTYYDFLLGVYKEIKTYYAAKLKE
jgi:hypothetical protein